MAGFFEFSLMRLRKDIDQKLLSELYYQYLNVEEEFIKQLFCSGETQPGRVFVSETALSAENSLHVLDYERASEIVKTARHIGVGICYCRHKMEHVGRACAAARDICLTFNNTAAALTRHGIARRIDAAEGLDLLQQARDQRLVQFGENVRESVNFICNCCGCCCEAMIAARRFGFLHPVHTSNFVPVINEAACTGCAKCVEACPVQALALVSASDPKRPKKKIARLDPEQCLGCAVCVTACPQRCICPRLAAAAGDHPAELHPPRRGHGHREGQAAEPDLRRAGPLEPPGHGRHPGGHPEAAAAEAGPGQPADEIALPRVPDPEA